MVPMNNDAERELWPAFARLSTARPCLWRGFRPVLSPERQSPDWRFPRPCPPEKLPQRSNLAIIPPAMFEQAFKNIDDVLRKEAGCTTELDYTEQTSWLLFLKYLDALELDKADEAALASTARSTPSSWTSPTAGTNGPHPRPPGTPISRLALRKVRPWTTTKSRPATTSPISLIASSFPIFTASSKEPAARILSNTKSAKSSAKSKTRSRAVTTSAKS